MGLKDLVTRDRSEPATKTALEAADDPQHDPGAIDRLVTMLLDVEALLVPQRRFDDGEELDGAGDPGA